MKKLYFTVSMMALALAVTGCSKSNNFTPAAGASAEDIYKAACAECHKKENGRIFELAADKANTAAVAKKITEGGMIMPSFPAIKDKELADLSKYIIDNSKVK